MPVTKTDVNRHSFSGQEGNWSYLGTVDDGKLTSSTLTWYVGGTTASVNLSVADFGTLQTLLNELAATVGPTLY